MIDDIKDFLEDYWLLVWMAIVGFVLIGFVIWLFIPRDYTLDVKRIQWEYVVHIEEFMVQHHDDDRSKPSDAYNVESHYHPRTKTWMDDDGKTHTRDDSYWTYDYDVNRWVETRSVVTMDYDHEPFFGEYALKESNREDDIGAERAIEEKIYRALGTKIHGDGELVELVIPEDMWETLVDTDEINYKESIVGWPHNLVVAK